MDDQERERLERALAVTVPMGFGPADVQGKSLAWVRQFKTSWLMRQVPARINKREFREALQVVKDHYGELIRRDDERQRAIRRWIMQ